MYVPELYLNVNTIQRTPNLLALELAQGSFRKSPTPDQQFVDLGCGTGDFTRQELLPRCQPCRRIVATDVSQEMVRFAERSFSHPQIEYDVYDFRDDASKIVRKYGRFDRAYSFFALHYAEDLVSALRNVADLMTDDGECLLVFAARIPGYAVWRKVVQMDRWKSYAEICERFIPKSQDFKDKEACVSYMLATLESANLKARICEVVTEVRSATNLERLLEVNIALNPVLPLVPEESRSEFKADLEEVVGKFWTEKDPQDPQYHVDTFVIHAGKI
ncbi:juvenile hormone acid O-methyltransferase [Ixodes scapularis]|uniref:juvenile hormone acid O-methyltransferase n=1 Tax=Ixodes scapularis TaxID=6945 RepID=UPI001A9F5089|nr:juvenile hormone acid O-methyltransferase [Ixodes scapularis]